MKNVSRKKIQELLVPLPPSKEQHRIVAKVDELMTLCDRLKARLGKAGETRAHLAEAVVKRAVS